MVATGSAARWYHPAGKALITTFGASFLSAVAEATKPQAILTLDQNPGEQTTFQTPDMTDVGKMAYWVASRWC